MICGRTRFALTFFNFYFRDGNEPSERACWSFRFTELLAMQPGSHICECPRVNRLNTSRLAACILTDTQVAWASSKSTAFTTSLVRLRRGGSLMLLRQSNFHTNLKKLICTCAIKTKIVVNGLDRSARKRNSQDCSLHLPQKQFYIKF